MVHFVGAGPGAADLITVRGKSLLEKADVVIYAGSLVNPALLAYTKKDCRIYNSAHMDLPDIIKVILDAEERGCMTVRLHTGDTSVYSAIREQMDELDRYGISYDVTPGVSAFQAAAASLQAELTLPGISQSVILTRGSGRTKVPDRESLRSFAKHRTTMVLYLSSSMAESVQKELLEGGYPPDTSVDVVYKASWSEEKLIRSDLRNFPERMEEEHITKTALILVGDVLAACGSETNKRKSFQKSRLYDPSFSTEIRRGNVLHVWMAACTRNGTEKMRELKSAWEKKAEKEEKQIRFELHVKCSAMEENETKSLKALTKEAFGASDVMIFFSSTGIAVRSIAPFLKSKMTDPAVLVIDEQGQNCIPLVSGHIGGANAYAEEVGKMIRAHAIVTTATDLEKKFSVDTFAQKNGLTITDMNAAKEISARIVEGEEILLASDFPVKGKMPDGIRMTSDPLQADILITADRKCIPDSSETRRSSEDETVSEKNPLILIPKVYDLGIGCRRNTSFEEIRSAVDAALEKLDTVPAAIHKIGSIDLKKDESAFSKIQEAYHRTPEFFTAEELKSVPGVFTSSEFVSKITGVDNVCERSAVRLSGGKLILPKTVIGNVTMAAAERTVALSSLVDS